MVEYPADWKVITLGSCFDMCAAGDLLKEYFSASYDSEHKWCIYSNAITNAGRYGYTSRPRYKGNALTITGRGTLGHAEYRDEDFDAIIRLIVLTPRNGVDCRFVTYWINFCNPFVRESTSIPQLTVPQVMNIQISLPTLPEQKRIAAVLTNADKLIANVEKRIAKKRAIKQGAMQELLTGKKRLPGFSGEWERKQFGDVLSYEQPHKYIVQNDEYVTTGIPVLTAGKSFVLGYTQEQSGIYNTLPVILFDDFLTVSRYVMVPFKVKSSAVKMLKAKDSNDSLYFIYASMQVLGFTPSDHQRHWIGIYSKFPIMMPEAEEQQAIAKVLSGMDAEIANLERKLKKLKLMKQGMMQDLLTGKVRLK